MDSDAFAKRLYSEERKEWQDPIETARKIGIRKGMVVADLGCGPGFFTLPVASLVGGRGLVYAVDADPTMLRHLRANIEKTGTDAERVRTIRADVSKTGIPSSSVDLTLLVLVLHDIEDKGSLFREIRRISKQGASVVNVDWRKVRSTVGPPLDIRLSKDESMKLLSGAGFRVTTSISAGPHLYGFVCRV